MLLYCTRIYFSLFSRTLYARITKMFLSFRWIQRIIAIKLLKYKLFWQICFVTSKIIAPGINLLYIMLEMKVRNKGMLQAKSFSFMPCIEIVYKCIYTFLRRVYVYMWKLLNFMMTENVIISVKVYPEYFNEIICIPRT